MHRFFLALAITAVAVSPLAQPARADTATCNEALSTLMAKWHAIGYPMPLKPSQAHVLGKDGHDASGQQVIYMRQQINLSARECKAGSDAAALTRIAAVTPMLDKQATRTAKQ